MLKAVSRSSSFLWKKPENNSVLTKIHAAPKEALHTFLTSADTMELFNDRLVDSEVIYGTLVEVVAEKDGWSEVIVLDQASHQNEKGYPGFIPTADLTKVSADYGKAAGKISVIVPKADLKLADHTRPVPFGTVLDLSSETATEYLVNTPEGPGTISKAGSQKITAYQDSLTQRMIQLAEQFLDLPYIWAGTSGSGFDCSGFVYSLHRANGVLIPRDTPEQAEGGQHVAYEDALPGDLLLFAYEEGKGEVHHVGMYLGNDEMIHSQTPGSKVMKTKIAGSKYEPELTVVARYWTDEKINREGR
ncbi:C40 family peptidase [Enterococcus sp. LJL120]